MVSQRSWLRNRSTPPAFNSRVRCRDARTSAAADIEAGGASGCQHPGDKRRAGLAIVNDMLTCRRLHGRRFAFPATVRPAAGDEDPNGYGYHAGEFGDIDADPLDVAGDKPK